MELNGSVPRYQDKLVSCLDGLYILMNFLKATGDHLNGSGLAEVWIESGLLRQDGVEVILAGKAYSKL